MTLDQLHSLCSIKGTLMVVGELAQIFKMRFLCIKKDLSKLLSGGTEENHQYIREKSVFGFRMINFEAGIKISPGYLIRNRVQISSKSVMQFRRRGHMDGQTDRQTDRYDLQV
jgi:hypothetical protein